MRWLSNITSRIVCSILSIILYSLFLSIVMFKTANPFGAIVVSLFAFTIAWTGILFLLIASLAIDEFVLNKYVTKLNEKYNIILLILIYGFLGYFLARFIYGSNSFYCVSGSSIAVLYMLLYQAYLKINEYTNNKQMESPIDS